jgi:hypothetical protein
LVDLTYVDTLLEHLVAIDIHKELRHVRQKRREEARKFRTFLRGGHELL